MTNTEQIAAMAERIEKLEEALKDAAAQIEYMHEKFQETGSGNAVLVRILALLSSGDQG